MVSLFTTVSGCGSRTSLADFGGLASIGGGSGGSQSGSGALPGTGGSGGHVPSGGAPNGGFGTGGIAPIGVCAPGWFSADPDTIPCQPWTQCPWEQPELAPPSMTMDRDCAGLQHFRQFGTELPDQLQDVAVDAQGNIYVSGFTYGSLEGDSIGEADGFVRKYSPAGEVLWGYQGGGPGFDNAFHLKLGAYGQPHVVVGQAGQTTLWIFDSEGALLWEEIREAGGVDLAVDDIGMRFFARFVTLSDGAQDVELSKLYFDGTPLWTHTLDGGSYDVPAAVSVLPDGDILLAGVTDGALFRPSAGEGETFVARFSTDGELLWGLQFAVLDHDYVSSLAVDSAGRSYVVGVAWNADEQNDEAFVARVTPDGALEWVRTYGTSAYDEFTDVAVDGLDQVTVAGTTGGVFGGASQGARDAFVARILDSSDLGQVTQFGTASDDVAYGIAAAPDGAFFVVGMTMGGLEDVENAGLLDAYVLRVTPF